jgi:hypothetical protein
MIIKLISTVSVLAASAISPTAAIATEPARAQVASTSGIIAILIGQIHAQTFTPPIGTNHGSFTPRS